MDDKELKTEEAPASLLPGPAGASLQPGFIQVTSTDKNKMKPNKDPEHVAAGKKLAEHIIEEFERKRRRKEVQRIQAPRGQTMERQDYNQNHHHSHSLKFF